MRISAIFKILLSLSIIVFILLPVTNVNAEEPTGSNNDNFKLDVFNGEAEVPENINNFTNNTIKAAIGAIRLVGTSIAIIILLVISMKYMMASAGERAEIKKHAVPFVIGATVLFAAGGILTIILNFSNNIQVGQ